MFNIFSKSPGSVTMEQLALLYPVFCWTLALLQSVTEFPEVVGSLLRRLTWVSAVDAFAPEPCMQMVVLAT